MPTYLLYSRQGCCLCEGLEERLRDLMPPDGLRVVDVDTDPALQARYGLSVPVLALMGLGNQEDRPTITPLPPVPPRLQGEGLRAWLQRHSPP